MTALDEATRSALLEAFRASLESAPEPEAETEPKADLVSLFSELAALKSEVHLEARQFKTALERLGQMADALAADRDAMKERLARARDDADMAGKQALKPLLLELLDLRDRLEAGLNAAARYRPKRFTLCRRRLEAALIEALRDGQELTLRRLDNLLHAHAVRPIPVLDRELDPHTMRAAEVEHRSDTANGVVTAELRRGYFWDETVLRTAEVKVNKRPDNTTGLTGFGDQKPLARDDTQ